MKVIQLRLLVVALVVLCQACDDTAGTVPTVPDRVDFSLIDSMVEDMIAVDMAILIRDCEPGETRSCGTDEGACEVGRELCDQDGLWSGVCEGQVDPVDELCDEVDNDCDGTPDEEFRIGQACKWTDERNIERIGTIRCDALTAQPYCHPRMSCDVDLDGDRSNVCDDCDDTDPRNFPGNQERCDGQDNNCNERIDETFDVAAPCQVGEGICRRGGMKVCSATGLDTVCEGVPGDPEDEICDEEDDDCDGLVDEDFNLGEACGNGEGACRREGVWECAINGGRSCSADPGAPIPEICNELDDDCDGETDEELGVGEVCDVGLGVCAASGRQVCSEDGSVTCDAEAQDDQQIEEVCDGQDNDCDGDIDEGDPGGGGRCETGRNGVCGQGILHCREGGLICVPQAAANREICNDEDDDCNGIIDDVPGSGTPCSTGVGVCIRDGVMRCNGMLAGELQCEERNSNNHQPLEAGTPIDFDHDGLPDDRCNGEDDDCDGLTDEDYNLDEFCTVGLGLCTNEGRTICTVDGIGTRCDAAPLPQQSELCDTLDNDCDGQADEVVDVRGYGPQGGTICNSGLFGACARGHEYCFGGGLVCRADVEAGALPEICNDEDDDCDGAADENYEALGKGDDCADGQGLCRREGTMVCNEAQDGIRCTAEAAIPAQDVEAFCDGQDDDCDAMVDENFNLGTQCQEGFGVCRRVGVLRCVDAQMGDEGWGEVECSVEGAPPPREIEARCDEVDDDCDGIVDENFNVGGACDGNDPDQCANGTIVCQANDAVCVQDTPAIESCNGEDDDCDGIADEEWLGDENTPGLVPEGWPPEAPRPDRCDSDDSDMCERGQLSCTQDGLGLECLGDVEVAEICDGSGEDEDCDGIVDNGFDKSSDVNNCGACGNVCTGATPQCIQGRCYRTYFVSTTGSNGCNEADEPTVLLQRENQDYLCEAYEDPNDWGNGTAERPWRTIAFATDSVPAVQLTNNIPQSRIYVLPGRYAADTTVPEAFPIQVNDTVQILGCPNPEDGAVRCLEVDPTAVTVDGGTEACFQNINAGGCDRNTRPCGDDCKGTLFLLQNMLDDEGQRRPDFGGDPTDWGGRGSRNLIANLSIRSGGGTQVAWRSKPAIDVSTRADLLPPNLLPLPDGSIPRPAITFRDIHFVHNYATPGASVMTITDAEVLIEDSYFFDNYSRTARSIIQSTRSKLMVQRTKFYQNKIGNNHLYGLIRQGNGELKVHNSVFDFNEGSGLIYDAESTGEVLHSSFNGQGEHGLTIVRGIQGPITVANSSFSRNQAPGILARRGDWTNPLGNLNVIVHNNAFFANALGALSDNSAIYTVNAIGGGNLNTTVIATPRGLPIGTNFEADCRIGGANTEVSVAQVTSCTDAADLDPYTSDEDFHRVERPQCGVPDIGPIELAEQICE